MATDGPKDTGEELQTFLKEDLFKALPANKPTPSATSKSDNKSKDDLSLDDKEKEKNRVNKAWDDFNHALQTPAGKGQTDAESAAEAFAKLLENLFGGIELMRASAMHPKEAASFISDSTKENYEAVKKDLEEKSENIKDVKNKTGNVFQKFLKYATEQKEKVSDKKDVIDELPTSKLFSVAYHDPTKAKTDSSTPDTHQKEKVSPFKKRPNPF